MDGSRRLSQAIAEGDGISVLVDVVDATGARNAQEQGAEGLVVRRGTSFVPESCDLPLLSFGPADAAGLVDAVVVDATEDPDVLSDLVDAAHERGLECVLRVTDEDDLGEVLELVDPEIFLLATDGVEQGESLLGRLLELLADVPAGKLAIADLAGASRNDVVELERAGVDAVIVFGSDIASLVGDTLPDL